jgi:TPR repeat protein
MNSLSFGLMVKACPNDAEMVKWRTRSANQGLHNAMNAMGEIYTCGYGVKVD